MRKKKSGRTSSELVRSSEAARILGYSREYVRQLVFNKVLPPKYLFNVSEWRKICIFDRKLIERFNDPVERTKVKWKEPETCKWMTALELSEIIECSASWIYSATKKGFLEPELVIAANSRQPLQLYDKEKVEAAIKLDIERRKTRHGHTRKTFILMDKIKDLHAKGLNDSNIAIKLNTSQPFISKLRKEIGLSSNARIAAEKRKALAKQ